MFIAIKINELVFTTLHGNGENDAKEIAKKAVKIYDHRSTLVHNGKLEPIVLSNSISDAKDIVERILKIKFTELAKK